MGVPTPGDTDLAAVHRGCTSRGGEDRGSSGAQVEGSVAWSGFLVELLSGAVTEGVFEVSTVLAAEYYTILYSTTP